MANQYSGTYPIGQFAPLSSSTIYSDQNMTVLHPQQQFQNITFLQPNSSASSASSISIISPPSSQTPPLLPPQQSEAKYPFELMYFDKETIIRTSEGLAQKRKTYALQQLLQMKADPLYDSKPADRLDIQTQIRMMHALQFQNKLRQRILSIAQRISAERQTIPGSSSKSAISTAISSSMALKSRGGRSGPVELTADQILYRQICEEVKDRREEMVNIKAENAQRRKPLFKEMLKYVEKREKRRLRNQTEEEKKRLTLLKEEDMDSYLAGLATTKETHLLRLLEQTERILSELGVAITNAANGDQENKEEGGGDSHGEEKKEEAEVAPQVEAEPVNETPEAKAAAAALASRSRVIQEFKKSENKFYEITNRNREEITEQPKCMIGGDLKPYQMDGLRWLVSLYNNNLGGILADEMGLGKTIQTIALLGYILEKKGNAGPHLIIVQLNTLGNWFSEFQRWCPSLATIMYKGKKEERKELQRMYLGKRATRKFNVCLVQYELVMKDKNVLSNIDWQYIIMDEAHRIKNAESKLVKVLGPFKSRHRLLLTGTPLQNNLKELWSLLHFVLPRIFDDSGSFEKWFASPFESGSASGAAGGPANELTEEEMILVIRRLHQVLRPFLFRREKKLVEKELPQKIERLIRCELSAMQKLLYKQLQETNTLRMGASSGGSMSFSNRMMQLRKICNHPYLMFKDPSELFGSQLYSDLLVRSSGKFELLDRMLPKLRQTGHRCLLFSQLTKLLNVMEHYLKLRGFSYLRMDGNTPSEQREALMKEFNRPGSEYFIFILSTRACSSGINLQSADTVIVFDSDWNPQQDLQAHARVHRIGQTKEVRVFTLATASFVEEHILTTAASKRDAEAKVIGAGKYNHEYNEMERRALLEKLVKENIFDKPDFTEIPDDEELNKYLARSEEEFEIFQEMDHDLEDERRRRLGLPPAPAPMQISQDLGDADEEKEDDDELPSSSAAGASSSSKSGVNRLMTEEEIPDFLREQFIADQEQSAEANFINGEYPEDDYRSRKARKDVTYSDGLTEGEFLRAVDKGEDLTSLSARKRERRAASGYAGEENLSAEQQAAAQHLKRVSDSAIKIFDQVWNMKDAETGRDLRAWFMALPPRQLYPDYYILIRNPISLNVIRKKIKENKYRSLNEVEEDMQLLAKNAQTYNREGSELYIDSGALSAEFSRLKQLEPEELQHPPSHQHFDSAEQAEVSDGDDTFTSKEKKLRGPTKRKLLQLAEAYQWPSASVKPGGGNVIVIKLRGESLRKYGGPQPISSTPIPAVKSAPAFIAPKPVSVAPYPSPFSRPAPIAAPVYTSMPSSSAVRPPASQSYHHPHSQPYPQPAPYSHPTSYSQPASHVHPQHHNPAPKEEDRHHHFYDPEDEMEEEEEEDEEEQEGASEEDDASQSNSHNHSSSQPILRISLNQNRAPSLPSQSAFFDFEDEFSDEEQDQNDQHDGRSSKRMRMDEE